MTTSQQPPARTALERLLRDTSAMPLEWVESFRAVPRELFLPDVMWPFDLDAGRDVTVDRRIHPDQWHAWAETNVPITVQWDDGHHAGSIPGSVRTSSSSMPSIVFSMLNELDVQAGMRVLEIGTGTGWSAGLLSHRLGSENVISIEVDDQVATHARGNLKRAGYAPALVIGDGARGYPQGALFDRMHVTCGVREIPYTWVEQTRSGGTILAPWGTDYSPQNALVRLLVDEKGIASGHFTSPVQFMKARSHRLAWPQHNEYVTDWPGEISTTTLPKEAIASGNSYGTTEFILGLLVPDCTHVVHEHDKGVNVWFYGLDDRSWALARFTNDAEAVVHQSGPRHLWDEIAATYQWWKEHNFPARDHFGLTITPEGHQLWLDTPTQLVG